MKKQNRRNRQKKIFGTSAGKSDDESVGTDGVADEENNDQGWITTTRSGRRSRPPTCYQN